MPVWRVFSPSSPPRPLKPAPSVPHRPQKGLAQSFPREITAARAQFGADPTRVAGQLANAVFNMLEKKVTISVPSAVQVLETLAGDCNEHTVLYVALARALGLPARTAVGLVYLRGSFFYHAWP